MAKKKSGALARLVESIEIKNPDGTTTLVPVSKEDNATANKILASQMRSLIQKHIEKMGNLDVMTPKELKEMTEAAKNIAEFSGEVYKDGETIGDEEGEKKIDGVATDVLDFSKLKDNQTKSSPAKEGQEIPQDKEQKE